MSIKLKRITRILFVYYLVASGNYFIWPIIIIPYLLFLLTDKLSWKKHLGPVFSYIIVYKIGKQKKI